MRNVYSMTGANNATQGNWVWCVPGGASPLNLPVCVLVMSTEGPRYIPTHVIAAKRHRSHRAPYIEVRPTAEDTSLAEAVIAWNLRHAGSKVPTVVLAASALAANDVAAARRFLDYSGAARTANGKHVADEDLYFGRSVLVCPPNSLVPVPGWIASVEEPFDVVIRDKSGLFRKITANADSLIEDDPPRQSHQDIEPMALMGELTPDNFTAPQYQSRLFGDHPGKGK